MTLRHPRLSRRTFLAGSAAGLAAARLPRPAFAQAGRPVLTHGLQSGDVTSASGIVWARADRPSRLLVEVAATERFANPRLVVGPELLDIDDFTGMVDLTDLPAGQDIFYRVRLQSLTDLDALSEPAIGRFRTAPAGRQGISFVWGADTAGQGWGINPDWGGMRIYEMMRAQTPDFFVHSGDTIYADNPIEPTKETPDGGVWTNLVTEAKAKVAETLAEFRGNYQYNLLDENLRRFNAEVPMLAQWDDHETTNNWYPTEILEDDRYTEKNVALLAARARRAFLDYMPIRRSMAGPGGVFRAIPYGPSLDLFFLDMRTFRGPNTANRQPVPGPVTDFLGAAQIRWLKQQLLASRATWKVIASDMPIGLLVRDGDTAFENLANGNGPVLGREHEMAGLLRFIRDNGISNTVWITGDVHYTAAHYYDPGRAVFREFAPFWEFVAGPLNAGTFGPGELDDTFGPQAVFVKAPPPGQANLPPSAGLQFFGHVRIDGDTEVMTVTLKDLTGAALFTVDLEPAF